MTGIAEFGEVAKGGESNVAVLQIAAGGIGCPAVSDSAEGIEAGTPDRRGVVVLSQVVQVRTGAGQRDRTSRSGGGFAVAISISLYTFIESMETISPPRRRAS